MIKGIIDKVEDEEVDKMYEAGLRNNEPAASREAEPEPVSWDEATQDLVEIPQREPSRETEMEDRETPC